ncbi:MAG: ABC transporter permease [Candidatus Woesearchaeota archaeon]
MKKKVKLALMISTFAVLIAAVELISRTGIINPYFLPAPSKVIQTMWRERDFIFGNAWVSIIRMITAYAIGTSLGILLGIAVGWYKHVEATMGSVLNALYSVPKLTFLPLFILWLGLDNIAFLAVTVLSTFFPTFLNTYSGVKKTDKAYIELFNNFKGKKTDMLRKIVIPAALPYISTGLRMSIGTVLTITTVTEMAMADKGIGAIIWRGGAVFRADYIVAGQIILAVFGVSMFALYDLIEGKLLLNWMNTKKNGVTNKRYYQEL